MLFGVSPPDNSINNVDVSMSDENGEADATDSMLMSSPQVPLFHADSRNCSNSGSSSAPPPPAPQSMHTNSTNIACNGALMTTAEVTDTSESSAGTEFSNCNTGIVTQINSRASPPNSTIDSCSKHNSHSSPALEKNRMQLTQKDVGSLTYVQPHGRESVLRRLSETLVRGTLTLIDLSQRSLASHDANLIRLALLHNPNLSTLKLGYNNLGDDGTSIIASAVHGHPHLSVLDIGFNNIGDKGCVALADHAVSGNYVLQTLYLSGNTVCENGAFALARAIGQTGCGLKCLHLTANRIKAIGVKALTRAIAESESRLQALRVATANSQNYSETKEHSITSESYVSSSTNNSSAVEMHDHRLEGLFLGGTEMNSVGCLSVSNMLLTNYALRVLSLSDNNITDKDLSLFSQSISRNKLVPLEVIQLSFNQLTCVGVESLMNAVWGSTTLRELQLDNNRIRDRGAQLVAVVLTAVNLEVVDLGFNVITTVGVKALMKSLADNESVLSLTLSGNPLDTTASKAVSYALAYNTNLLSLYMDNCSIGYAAQRHIAAGVASNSSSALCRITGFGIGAIAVTLGLPPALEHWTNDQVLSFFRHMWEGWRKELQKDEENDQNERSGNNISSVSLPSRGKSNQSRCSLEKESKSVGGTQNQNRDDNDSNTVSGNKKGPRDPTTVVSVAKTAFENLGNGTGNQLQPQHNHWKVSQQSPLAPNLEIIMETTSSGVTRVPPVDNILHHQTIPGPYSTQNDKYNTKMSFQTSDFGNGSHRTDHVLDPNKKDRILEWLRPHMQYLNEVSKQPFDNTDLWKLHQHFFSPVNGRGEVNQSHQNYNTEFGSHNIAPAITVPKSEPVSPLAHPELQAPSTFLKPKPSALGRKTSYRCLNDSMIAAPVSSNNRDIGNGAVATSTYQAQSSPRTTRRRSETTLEETYASSPSLQPASKRAKNARIAFYPRIRAKLESLRTKVSQHQTLVLMRQLKYVEDALFNGNSVYAGSGALSHSRVFVAADAEAILMDML